MGEMAEYCLEQELYFDIFEDYSNIELTWKTADGEIIPVSKMKDSHISNCLKLIKRRAEDDAFWIAVFTDELQKRNKI